MLTSGVQHRPLLVSGQRLGSAGAVGMWTSLVRDTMQAGALLSLITGPTLDSEGPKLASMGPSRSMGSLHRH